jgi:hypothetical protein
MYEEVVGIDRAMDIYTRREKRRREKTGESTEERATVEGTRDGATLNGMGEEI